MAVAPVRASEKPKIKPESLRENMSSWPACTAMSRWTVSVRKNDGAAAKNAYAGLGFFYPPLALPEYY